MQFFRSPICLLAFVLAGSLSAQTWTQATPSLSPSNRRASAACFDAVNGTVILYGGLLSPTAINGETWTWDGTTWTQIAPLTTPPPRWGHRMVFDTARQRVVTFGGRSPTTTATAADTWEWDGTNWQQVFPAASPPARAFYSMSYDERRGKTVIFGSQSPLQGSQVWEYDGITWVQAAPATTIASRETPGMVYDRGRGVTVMFGGWNATSPGTMYGDTWEWDGTNWRSVVTANSPPPRYRASMTYDTVRHRVVLYGGFGNAQALTDTWEYDGNDWIQVAANPGNISSSEMTAAFHEGLGTMVTLGGSGPGGTNNQTWDYVGPASGSFAIYGTGAAGGLGMPVLSGSVPGIGQTLTLTATSIPLTSTDCFVGLGLSNTNWAGRPLPSSLAPDGLPGCTLETSLDVILPWPVVGGTVVVPLVLPLDPALINQIFFAQILIGDSFAPNGICSMTQGGRVVIGP